MQGKAGCTCQICGGKYVTDVIVPDDLWELIKPLGKAHGSGLICGRCVFERIEGLGCFGAYNLVCATQIKIV